MTGEAGTRHIVVMGVSGCGKTTVAQRIAAATGWEFAEADQFHSPDKVAKMAAGTPLTDEDRWPWLRRLADWMGDRAAAGTSTVIACSALRRAYRDVLRSGPPHAVDFVHLDGPVEVVAQRLAVRSGHYMPASLLASQVATLEPLAPEEGGFVLDLRKSPEVLVSEAVALLSARPAAR